MQEYSIENISIKQYFELVDSSEYDIFIDVMQSSNVFNGKRCNLSKLSFDEVEYIKKLLNSRPSINDMMVLFIELFNLGSIDISAQNEFLNASVFDLFRCKKYIQDYIVEIVEREIKVLNGEPDTKLIMINASERMQPFSHVMSKMRLAEQFSVTPKEIGKWKYNEVFGYLVANKVNNDIQRDYQKQK